MFIIYKGLTVYKALKNANLHVGQWVAISGAGGGLGHLGWINLLHPMTVV